MTRRLGIEPALSRLAALHGIAPRYRDTTGQLVEIGPETLRALLGVLGVQANSPAVVERASAEERLRRRSLLIEPVLVHRGPTAPVIECAARRALAAASAELTVSLESGEEQAMGLSRLEALPARRGRRRLRLPEALPPGAHRLTLSGPATAASALLLTAPATLPPTRRGWGAFLPLYALRGEEDLGCGSYGDLGELAGLLAAHGAGVLATLPLYAPHEGAEIEASPYLPSSRLAWNDLFLDLRPLVERSGDEGARRSYEELVREGPGEEPRTVCYEALSGRRAPLLRSLARLASSRPAVRQQQDDFFDAHTELAAYCAFRAEMDPAGAASGADPAERLAFHRYVQFCADGQLGALAARGPGLLLDLPLGVHPAGVDVARYPTSFASGASVGAPPDPFQRDGQDWGFPPPNPAQRATGYEYLRACLRTAFSHASLLRLDHVMALERLWWIPAGAAPTEGAYVAAHADELRALVAIEAWRAGAAVVGEDLGTVSESIDRAMDEEQMLHSAVLEFSLRADRPLPAVPRRAVASIATHDLPRFAAFWRGTTVDGEAPPLAASPALRTHVLTELAVPADGPCATEQAFRGLLAHLARGPADVVRVDQEDCWLEEEPINRPGRRHCANWRHRSRFTLRELALEPGVVRVLQLLESTRGGP